MKIDDIYIGSIYLIKDEKVEKEKAILHLQFLQKKLVYQKKDSILKDFYDLKTNMIYRTNEYPFLIPGDLIINLKDGLLPFRKLYQEEYPNEEQFIDNIAKVKALKLYDDYDKKK